MVTVGMLQVARLSLAALLLAQVGYSVNPRPHNDVGGDHQLRTPGTASYPSQPATSTQLIRSAALQSHAAQEPLTKVPARRDEVVTSYTPVVLAAILVLAICGTVAAEKLQTRSSRFGTLCSAVGFMCCSSMMLVVNKIAVVELPFPLTVLALQLLVTALVVKGLGELKLVEVEPISWPKVRAFGATPFAFLLTLIANMKILEYANIETFIMIRTSTPIFTSALDYIFLDRELPDRQSAGSLLLAFVGAGCYMHVDAQFNIKSYSWCAIWLCIFLFDQVYIKHVISSVPMTSWSRVYYQNLLAGLPVLVMAGFLEDMPSNLVNGWVGPVAPAIAMLAISCCMSVAMSFFSFSAREALTATAFTVLGNACKVVSVLANVLLWDKHASQAGLSALAACLLGAAFYRPSPLRKDVASNDNWEQAVRTMQSKLAK